MDVVVRRRATDGQSLVETNLPAPGSQLGYVHNTQPHLLVINIDCLVTDSMRHSRWPVMRRPDELHHAIRANHAPDVISALMQHINVDQQELNICLASVMRRARFEIIIILIERGARMDERSYHHTMGRFGSEGPPIITMLQEYGFDIDNNEFYCTPIHHTLTSPALLSWLLDRGADPNTMSSPTGRYGQIPFSPLCEAAGHTHTVALQILLAHGAEVDPLAIFHAIGFSARNRDDSTATMQALIDHGADVNHVSERWSSPIFYCILAGGLEKLRLLLENGANVEVKNQKGKSVMQWAATYGRKENHMTLYKHSPPNASSEELVAAEDDFLQDLGTYGDGDLFRSETCRETQRGRTFRDGVIPSL